jgi:ADP-heptose:LPS heptosyltransferase
MKPCQHLDFVSTCNICIAHRDNPRLRAIWDRKVGQQRKPCGCGKRPATGRYDVLMCETIGHGVGDVVMSIVALAGLRAKYPNAKLIFRVQRDQAEWCRLFTGFEVSVDKVDPMPDCDYVCTPVDSYNRELADRWQSKTRAEWYCDECNCGKPGLPTLAPFTELEWAGQYRDCVCICPTSAWSSRELLPSWWKCLIHEIKKMGLRPVVICRDEPKIRQYACERLANESAARIASLMSVSRCFVGLDSGMSHVASCIVRSVVMCGPTNGSRIYNVYPNVECVQGGLPCTGCAWRGEFFSQQCNSNCASLMNIPIQTILGKL